MRGCVHCRDWGKDELHEAHARRDYGLVDTATAAVALGVTERTIRRWVATGRLANHGTTRRILVRLADLAHVR